MGYVFLWLEAMASALLMVAVVFSLSGRLKKWPTLWPIFMALLLVVPAIGATVFAGYLFFENIHPQWLFPYTFSWTLLFASGSWILIQWGRRIIGATPVAGTWHRLRLSGALLIALALQWSTTTALDNAAKLEAAADQTMVLNRAQTILPSTPSQDEDASDIYSHLKKEIGEIPEWFWDAATDPAFDPQSKKSKSLLRERKNAIALIKEAVQKPRLYHPLLLSYDFEVQEFAPPKNAARLLALEARIHARNDRLTDALKNISDMNQIAEHLNQTPTLVNVLFANVIHVEAKKTLEILLAQKPSDSKIKVNLPIKPHDHILQSFRTGMMFENFMNVFGVSTFLMKDQTMEDIFGDTLDNDTFDYKWQAFFWSHIGAPLYRIFLFPDDRDSHELYWETFHEYIKKPYYQSGSNFKEWHNHLDKNIDLGISMTINSYPAGNYFERITYQQTQFLLGRLGLAAAVYHSDHGKYPEKLDALTPKYITEIPIDPFSGKPLKMKTVKDGLILYSIGNDLEDDQGVAYDRETEEGDIAFYLGSAFKEHRLKPAIEKLKNVEEE